MTAIELLSDLRARGVQVEVNGDRLRIDAPRGVMTPEMRGALIAHKAELINALQRTSDLHYSMGDNPALGEPAEELCLAGCRLTVRFYWKDGTGYGYCPKCDMHQRIETRKQ